jgi:hypothetical protein
VIEDDPRPIPIRHRRIVRRALPSGNTHWHWHWRGLAARATLLNSMSFSVSGSVR